MATKQISGVTGAKQEPGCFKTFAQAVNARYAMLAEGELFMSVDGDALYEQYLAAFPEGTNPIFRERREYDCQTCRRFIRNLGCLVGLKNGEVQTVWDVREAVPYPFNVVAERLAMFVRAGEIKHVFRTKETQYGETHNYDAKTEQRYEHFCGVVGSKHCCDAPDTKRGEQDAIFQVCYRGLSELRLSDVDTVLDLIESNGLYKGEEYKPAIEGFQALHRRFMASTDKKRFVWENLDNRNARFRNTVIGTLLTDLAEGKDLDYAVKSFETKVAPQNYKRPTSVITQKMVEEAVQTLTDLGLHGAMARRYARLSDVSVNDVLFVDNSARGKMKDGIEALLADVVKQQTKRDFKNATRIAADEFIRNILPGTKTLEVLVENRHQGNFMSLTGGDGPERLFKWDNNFAWSYDGDVADSVKQRVKAAGGNINAILRVSLSWFNFDDLDLHAKTPKGQHIYYGNPTGVSYSNQRRILDVDMNAGRGATRTPVENLAFTQLDDGVYEIYVNQYNRRETADVGFAIEVEFGGVVHQHSYAKAVVNNVPCFRLHVKNGVLTKVETDLVGGASSQEKWGVKTETLVPVTAVMYSPNHWGENKAGPKHTLFILQGCQNPGTTRGIFNEYLDSRLEKHRKVFEVIGAKTKCAYATDQLSGVGFTAARGDSVAVVVDGRRDYVLQF